MLKFNSFVIFWLTLFNTPLYAGCYLDVAEYVGWQITYSGTVTGYLDEDGVRKDDFEGCEWGRVLIIDHSKSVECSGYSYSYAYNPDIVIMTDGVKMVACIDNEIYDLAR